MKKIFLIITLTLLFFPFASAFQINSSNYQSDTIISSGGANASSGNYKINFASGIIAGNASSTLYQSIFGFFRCTPYTCSNLGYNCGTWSDGCGGTINCGTCASGYTCSAGTCVVTPTTGVTPSGAGGGGAMITTQPLLELKAIPTSFNIPATVGIKSSGKISLLNTGGKGFNITITLSNLQGIIEFEQKTFFLRAGETKILEFKINPPNEPGIYTGKIIFISQNKRLEVPLVLNVDSELSLFDISVDLADKYKEIKEGEKIKGQITLIQAGLQEERDVTMEYIIKDFDGNVYLMESETISVFKQKTYEKEFSTQNLKPDDYVIGVQVIYSGGVATASSHFKVLEKTKIKGPNFIFLAELLTAIFILIILIVIAKNYKRKKI
ncbi:hypothetical protein DRN69_01710 [Candidatus Pacearchaeota archaeon]|nr:MAG: hypothetical protein DRN69_01710 [Candidatus Pacearchaeota archaeon]